MITYASGNLMDAPVDALVNTVNCVGIMGKGVALQFKQAYPTNFTEYVRACKADEVQPGRMFITQTGTVLPPYYIINFPTKRHWKGNSRIEDIESGLHALSQDIVRLGIKSIALPALGCGNGGLDWQDVRHRIEEALGKLNDVEVIVFAPQDAPAPGEMYIARQDAKLTRARALLLLLFDAYSAHSYSLSRLEAQKLAYFLQTAGESLKLRYEKQQYGPYAHNLNHTLQAMEGAFIRGYGDGTQSSEIQALPDAVRQAREFLANDREALQRLQKVENLIAGFETPYGLELLATVLWIVEEDSSLSQDVESIVIATQSWNERKKQRYQPQHIRLAWERLQNEHWMPRNFNAIRPGAAA